MKLDGKVALVTGAGRGIGRAIALAFAEEGADVAVNALHLSSAESTAEEIRKIGRRAIAIEADVADVEALRRMIERTLGELGRIDILANVAGNPVKHVPTAELPLEQFEQLIDTHLRGTFLCCRQVGQWMIDHDGGKILNIGSIAAVRGFPRRVGYGAAKAGIVSLTKTLAVEWAKHNINVNCISPGYILTPRTESGLKEGKYGMEYLIGRIPLGRLGEPEDIARAALFLVSEDAKYITGVNLPVDGGWLVV